MIEGHSVREIFPFTVFPIQQRPPPNDVNDEGETTVSLDNILRFSHPIIAAKEASCVTVAACPRQARNMDVRKKTWNGNIAA
jgi:hypothetical protein